MLAFIPSPPAGGIHLGPLFVHVYGLMYVIGIAQAVGRVGNYFNQELFGKPSGLPWALAISPAARASAGIPAGDLKYGTFQPSFLYEMIFDLALAALLVWLGRRGRIRPQGLFAL